MGSGGTDTQSATVAVTQPQVPTVAVGAGGGGGGGGNSSPSAPPSPTAPSAPSTPNTSTTTVPPKTVSGAPLFTPGDVIKTTSKLNVRAAPSTTAKVLSIQPTGATGRVVSATPITANGYTWYQVKYNNGTTGWNVSNNIVKNTSSTTTPASTSSTIVKYPGYTSISKSLSLNMQGEDVKTLQAILKKLGYYTGDIGGFFGAKTEKALQDFQKAKGIISSGTPANGFGVTGPKTRAALSAEVGR
jgi:hypothetical protein